MLPDVGTRGLSTTWQLPWTTLLEEADLAWQQENATKHQAKVVLLQAGSEETS